MPNVSERSKAIPVSPFRKLVPIADQAKARGKKVYHLNIGQPDIPTPPQAVRRLQTTEIGVLAYSPAVGLRSYREKLAGYYEGFGATVDPDSIIVTTGASEAIQFLCFACFDEGDEVVVPEPFYANYDGFAKMAGIHIVPVPSSIEDGFPLPGKADFEARITSRTRAIFINNPGNPTGAFYSRADLEHLAEIVRRHRLFLIVDEVYREFIFDDKVFYSALRLDTIADQVIVVDSVSKRYSACGARVGALVTRHQGVLETLTRFAKLRLSPPVLGQLLSEAMLEEDPAYLEAAAAEYDRRRKVVYERLQRMPGVLSYLPGGAFYCFARFPVADAEEFCRWLLESFDHQGATVMLSPGKSFYATPGRGLNEVRIAFILNERDLHAAMDCLEAGLARYLELELQVAGRH